jgi:polyribonucleotide nucleotidyltransferase
MLHRDTINIPVGDKTLKFETGKIARQANGSVLVHCNETIVFASACASPQAAEGIDFLPLKVDYQQKYSSAGRTAGGFLKREGRPSEAEIIVDRLIDRPLRPMFEEGYHNEVQILSYVFSFDGVNSPDVLAICAASAALTISDIPLIKPIGAVRIGLVNDQFIINPTLEEMEASELDLVLAGTEDAILMIEGFCDFLTEEQVLEAIEKGHAAIAIICQHLSAWREKIGRPKKRDSLRTISQEIHTAVHAAASTLVQSALQISSKQERDTLISEILQTVFKTIDPEGTADKQTKTDITLSFKTLQATLMRETILTQKKRIDGRGLKDIRFIDIEQSILPRTHGSSLFTRGETQALAVCTLGGENAAQRFENLLGENASRFYLQYFLKSLSELFLFVDYLKIRDEML